MSVKDPRINMCVLSGKVSKEYEERVGGDYINGKVSIEIFNLSYDSKTQKKEYKPIAIEVKVLGRPEAKGGSPLGVMRTLKVGDRVVVTGRFECDFWRPKDNPEKEYSKLYIQASAVQTFEAEDKPAPKTKGDPEPDAPTTEDDIPF
jgi:single-stranded DNA-binding protein